MTTVFLSGSRKLSRLSKDIQSRLDNMIGNKLEIITGDANGADKAMQSYLAEKGYQNVTIYYVGDQPRNNIGKWPTQHVDTGRKTSGRDFYASKDKEMSSIADIGLVLWDGKSPGSVQNMLWLASNGKKIVVFYSPKKQFYNFGTEQDVVNFLSQIDNETIWEIGRKISLPENLKSLASRQTSFIL